MEKQNKMGGIEMKEEFSLSKKIQKWNDHLIGEDGTLDLEEEFDLSEKAVNFEQLVTEKGIDGCHIPVKDVKEFIRRLKEEIDENIKFMVKNNIYEYKAIFGYIEVIKELIDRLAGEKLIKWKI